jgi:hypothetical protein
MPLGMDALVRKGAAIRLQELLAERAEILKFLKEMRTVKPTASAVNVSDEEVEPSSLQSRPRLVSLAGLPCRQ